MIFSLTIAMLLIILTFAGCSSNRTTYEPDITVKDTVEPIATMPEPPAPLEELAIDLTSLPFEEAFQKIMQLYGQTPDLIAVAGENHRPRWLDITQYGFTLLFMAKDFPTHIVVESLGFNQQLFCLLTLADNMTATLLAAEYVQLNETEFYRQQDSTIIKLYFEGEDLLVHYSLSQYPINNVEFDGSLLENCNFFRSVHSQGRWGEFLWGWQSSELLIAANVQPIPESMLDISHIDLQFFYEQGVPWPCAALRSGVWNSPHGWQRYVVFEYNSVGHPAERAEIFHLTMEAAEFTHVGELAYTNGVVNVSLSFELARWAQHGNVDAFVSLKCYSMDFEPAGPQPPASLVFENTEWGMNFVREWDFPMPPRYSTLSASQQHTIAIREDGTVWVWGGCTWDWNPVAGDGSSYALYPIMVMENAVHVVAGLSYSLAVDRNGVLWTWGCNQFGQLGDGTNENRATPTQILNDVVYATVSPAFFSSHVGDTPRTYAITADGVLWGWGYNGQLDFFSALGDGTIEPRNSPVEILQNVRHVIATADGGYAFTHCGATWHWNQENLSPVIIDSFLASYSQFAICENGTLWAIGRSRWPDHWREWQPVLGDGTTLDRNHPVKIMKNVASVVQSANFVYAIDETGTLWGWGFNTFGFLGDGTMEDRFAPVRIMDNVAQIVSNYMMCHGWLGFKSTFVLTSCGAVWAWGGSGSNPTQLLLGDGTSESRISPVLVLDGVRSPE